LREDFLGLLEEASDRIPQILDNRFRLAPLDCETAAEAITRPAQIDDLKFATKPFRFDADVVPFILNYLTRTEAGGRQSSRRYVEPFHLQLICQRIERTVGERQKTSNSMVQFSLSDLGGEAALAETLSGFYEDAIHSLNGLMLQRAARRMCEDYLISPEGRRLSLEEHVLREQLKLPQEALRQLVDCRLLRTDRRANSTYYELGHDSLVQPVLDSGRTQGLLFGMLLSVVGWIVLVLAVAVVAFSIVFGADSLKIVRTDPTNFVGAIFMFVAGIAVGYPGLRCIGIGKRYRRRYRRSDSVKVVRAVPAAQA
jgi:hypothetical protein